MRFPVFHALLGAGALAASAPLLAGSSVTPISVDLNSPRAIGQVTLWNAGDAPMLVQASAVRWTQQDGKDVHADAPEVMIAPAIVEVPPHQGQIFRLRLRTAFPQAEQTWRLRLEDITPPKPGGGVGMRVRHDLPVVIGPPGGKPALAVTPCPAGPAGCIRVTNTGSHLARVTGVELAATGWSRALPASGVVLAGAWREWQVQLPAHAAGNATATVRTTAGSASGSWPVGNP